MTDYPARVQFEATVGVAQFMGQPNVVPGSERTQPELAPTDYTINYPAGMFTLLTAQPPEVTHISVLFMHTNAPPPPPQLPDWGGDDANMMDFAAMRQYVQQSRAFLTGTPTLADVVTQVRRNTRVILALLRDRMPTGGGLPLP